MTNCGRGEESPNGKTAPGQKTEREGVSSGVSEVNIREYKKSRHSDQGRKKLRKSEKGREG